MTDKPQQPQRTGAHPDPTHLMATAKVRYGFYLAVLVLSVMIYYMVQFRYMTEEAPQKAKVEAAPAEPLDSPQN